VVAATRYSKFVSLASLHTSCVITVGGKQLGFGLPAVTCPMLAALLQMLSSTEILSLLSRALYLKYVLFHKNGGRCYNMGKHLCYTKLPTNSDQKLIQEPLRISQMHHVPSILHINTAKKIIV
jgi:hypothetical protein